MPIKATHPPDAAAPPIAGLPDRATAHATLLPPAGTLVDNVVSGSTRSAVERWQDGLPLPAAASDGTCSPAAPPTPVGFGFNATSSCLASYSQAQLATFCTGGSNAAVANALGGLMADLVAGNVQVGVWGNSDYSNTADWVPLVPTGYSAAAVMTWSAATATCSNVQIGRAHV